MIELEEVDITISDKPQIEYENPCPHCLYCEVNADPERHEESCPVATQARREEREIARSPLMQKLTERNYIELDTEA